MCVDYAESGRQLRIFLDANALNLFIPMLVPGRECRAIAASHQMQPSANHDAIVGGMDLGIHRLEQLSSTRTLRKAE